MTPAEQSYRQIPLTQGQFAKVDADDYERLVKHKWYCFLAPKTGTFYACRQVSVGNNKQRVMYMAREILQVEDGAVIVDHINHDTLDNRKENLRSCSGAENRRNSRPQRNNSSGVRGLSWHKRMSKWAAKGTANGKRVWIGAYDNKEDAVLAIDLFAKQHHGEFAYLQSSKMAPCRP